jgi:hypothetical protein
MELLGDAGHVEPRFGLFGDNVSIHKRKVHCLRRTYYKLKNCFRHTMKLLGDLGHVESRFGLFAGSANLDARLAHGLRRTYHRNRNHFGRT